MAAVKSPELRKALLECADPRVAGIIAMVTTNAVNEIINQAVVRYGANAATSIVARAMIARSVAVIAGAWWSQCSGHPEPETFAALKDIFNDPPADWEIVLTTTGG